MFIMQLSIRKDLRLLGGLLEIMLEYLLPFSGILI